MLLDVPMPPTEAVPRVAGLLMLQFNVSPSVSVALSVSAKAVGEPSSDIVTFTESPSVITGAELITWLS